MFSSRMPHLRHEFLAQRIFSSVTPAAYASKLPFGKGPNWIFGLDGWNALNRQTQLATPRIPECARDSNGADSSKDAMI